MLISRSFYFFNLFSLSNNISFFQFYNTLSTPFISKISIGFLVPETKRNADIRLVFSFFILYTLTNQLPRILKFRKYHFEQFGKKFNKTKYVSSSSFDNINKFLFFDFLIDSVFTNFMFEFISLIKYSYPIKNKFVCLFKHAIFLPQIPEFISFYNCFFFFSFFLTNIFETNLNDDIAHEIFSILDLKKNVKQSKI